MSDCIEEQGPSNRPSNLRTLSASLWSIVKNDEMDNFHHAVDIANTLFKALPNLISTNTFCDLILDLKIKALVHVMSHGEEIDHVEVFNLLNYLFPIKDADVEIGSQYQIRHRKVRTRLLQLLAEEESRDLYIKDYLKYGSCGCLTRVIQNRVKQYVDILDNHLETADINEQSFEPGNRSAISETNTLAAGPVSATKTCLTTPTMVPSTSGNVTEARSCARLQEPTDKHSKTHSVKTNNSGCRNYRKDSHQKRSAKSRKRKLDECQSPKEEDDRRHNKEELKKDETQQSSVKRKRELPREAEDVTEVCIDDSPVNSGSSEKKLNTCGAPGYTCAMT